VLLEPRASRQDRFARAAGGRLQDAIPVALGVLESERIEGGDPGEELREGAGIRQQLGVLPRRDAVPRNAEVVLAPRADPLGPLDVLAIEDFVALRALHPDAGRPFRLRVLAGVPFSADAEHCALLLRRRCGRAVPSGACGLATQAGSRKRSRTMITASSRSFR